MTDIVNPIVKAIITRLMSSKIGGSAINELSEATWQWIRPVFLKDDPDFVNELENNPNDTDLKAELKGKINRKLKSDSDFLEKASTFAKSLNNSKETRKNISINQENTHGDNVIGDINF